MLQTLLIYFLLGALLAWPLWKLLRLQGRHRRFTHFGNRCLMPYIPLHQRAEHPRAVQTKR